MKVTFRFTGKELPGYIRLRAQGKTWCFDKDTTVDLEPCKTLDVEMECISAIQYLTWKIPNPVLRTLLYIPITILALVIVPIFFFVDTYDGGLSAENLFSGLHPFWIKESFTISEPEGKTISISYRDTKYQRIFKKYSMPELSVDELFVTCTASEVVYSEKRLKEQFLSVAVPGFTLLWIVAGFLNYVAIAVLAKVIRELPVNSLGWNVFAIAGTGVCFLVVFGLLIALIHRFCKLYKMCGKITQYQNDENRDCNTIR